MRKLEAVNPGFCKKNGSYSRTVFFRWDISVISCWDILVAETFRSFVSQLC